MIRLTPTVDHDAAFWDAAYARGDGQRWTIWIDGNLAAATGRWIMSEDSIYNRMLSVACGIGHAIEAINVYMPDGSYQWTGMDYAQYDGMIDNAKNFVRHDVSHRPWPFRDRDFDYAICSEILESLDDPVAAVRECQRIARRTMITLPISMELLSAGHKWLFERSDAEALLPGCEVIELRGGKLLACFQR